MSLCGGVIWSKYVPDAYEPDFLLLFRFGAHPLPLLSLDELITFW